jgi:hypothetical protein
MESDKEAEIGDVQDFPEYVGERIEVETLGEESDDEDVFNLSVSLAILDTETDEVDAEFLEAVAEIEGKKSFPCLKCDKICKSKGGLTRHTNSKHREQVDVPDSDEFTDGNGLSFKNLAGIVEAIKTNLIDEDLYGPTTNTAIKSASCNKALFDAVLPLYNKFCRKKNQDKLLEEFYGLTLDSSKYLNCPDSNAANIIMIEIPDRLVGFYKIQARSGDKSTETTTASDFKLDPSERGPLSYIAGYIVSKLYHKTRTKGKGECGEDLQALLQSLKSDETEKFILARSRGGLVSPSHYLMGIVEEAEICFRKNVGQSELVIRNIPAEIICESTLQSPIVKSLWDNIVLESGIEESSTTQKLCLENIVKLYVRVRSFSYARDYISKYKIKEKQTKSKSLRKGLKQGKTID